MPQLNRGLARNKSFFAVPFYNNVSLLAYRQDKVNKSAIAKWESLAAACKDWEDGHPGMTSLFFDFPQTTLEHYNCLFFEILLSLESLE